MRCNVFFAKLIKGVIMIKGYEVTFMENTEKTMLTAAVVTLSDRGASGLREDESGMLVKERLTAAGYAVTDYVLLPDDEDRIRNELIRLADEKNINLIITTGGTGFSPRDVTPEATMAVATRNAPGIAEAIRAESLKVTGRAMLSRAASVIRNRTLIVNLPGSRKAVDECLDVCLPQLEHGIKILLGLDGECGRK
jgi:molybdenum cofactor synthesis domain-containing protein